MSDAKAGANRTPEYRRVLLKLSGEALMGPRASGIDADTISRISGDVVAAAAAGHQICLVVGGGNIFRGVQGVAQGIDRGTADYMGMLATVMNALALQGAIEKHGVPSRVLSAIPMPTVCEPFAAPKARRHLDKGRIVIFAAGTGNPYFTTDTAAALRASEMHCDVMLKATQVDGVYSADPKKDPAAVRYEKLSFGQALEANLGVMDGAAIALARDNDLPIIVFAITEPGGLLQVLSGEGRYTLVCNAR